MKDRGGGRGVSQSTVQGSTSPVQPSLQLGWGRSPPHRAQQLLIALLQDMAHQSTMTRKVRWGTHPVSPGPGHGVPLRWALPLPLLAFLLSQLTSS